MQIQIMTLYHLNGYIKLIIVDEIFNNFMWSNQLYSICDYSFYILCKYFLRVLLYDYYIVIFAIFDKLL